MKGGGKLKIRFKNWLWAWFFIAPTVIGVSVLNLWSVLRSVFFSFTEARGFASPRFIGPGNYIRLFGDAELIRAVFNTFIYAVMTVPVAVFLSLLVAALLNSKIKMKSLFRIVYFLPVISAPVAIALVWKWLYSREFGLINNILALAGISGFDWLGDRGLVMFSISIVGIWSIVGYNMVILLAGLQEIPVSMYEAAEIDGANPVVKFFRITIPMVSPTLFFVIVTATVSALQMFDYTYMMLDPNNLGPSFRYAQTIVYHFYRNTFQLYNRGYGSTVAVFLLGITLILTIIQMRVQKKWVHYG
ncbi:MAG: sugar ABC transporter permease [Treponema sp.]|jgi:multiple sugar transport system permease protein|nr:sugar ABC transporter permease [Treponema sp.]